MAESNIFNTDNVVEFAANVADGKILEAEVPEGAEMHEWTFTNDKSNMPIRQLFHMLYQSVFNNSLGIMHAKRRDSDEIHTLVVGLQMTEAGMATWPIARLLTEEEQTMYQAPDGNGNYID